MRSVLSSGGDRDDLDGRVRGRGGANAGADDPKIIVSTAAAALPGSASEANEDLAPGTLTSSGLPDDDLHLTPPLRWRRLRPRVQVAGARPVPPPHG
jgi:hypothetical protein